MCPVMQRDPVRVVKLDKPHVCDHDDLDGMLNARRPDNEVLKDPEDVPNNE